jgi:hypothetical protein
MVQWVQTNNPLSCRLLKCEVFPNPGFGSRFQGVGDLPRGMNTRVTEHVSLKGAREPRTFVPRTWHEIWGARDAPRRDLRKDAADSLYRRPFFGWKVRTEGSLLCIMILLQPPIPSVLTGDWIEEPTGT